MYLWRIELDLSAPLARKALEDCQRMHQLVTGLFAVSRQESQALYRCRSDGHRVTLYLTSAVPLQEDRLPAGFRLTGGREVSDWLKTLDTGRTMRFDLLTMPSKKISDGESKNSRRRVLRSREERLNWLARKAEGSGFRLLSVREESDQRFSGVRPEERGGKLYLNCWRYTGILQITDGPAFQTALVRGIGPEKSYGLGMLLLA